MVLSLNQRDIKQIDTMPDGWMEDWAESDEINGIKKEEYFK